VIDQDAVDQKINLSYSENQIIFPQPNSMRVEFHSFPDFNFCQNSMNNENIIPYC
jgi:hypothetical protein